MGYYIETDASTGKAQWLVFNENAEFVQQPDSFDGVPEDKALICVVNNFIFEAAAYCFSPEEFEVFTLPDDVRPKKWLLMDKVRAESMSGYKQ